jgi:hypothetical protein
MEIVDTPYGEDVEENPRDISRYGYAYDGSIAYDDDEQKPEEVDDVLTLFEIFQRICRKFLG